MNLHLLEAIFWYILVRLGAERAVNQLLSGIFQLADGWRSGHRFVRSDVRHWGCSSLVLCQAPSARRSYPDPSWGQARFSQPFDNENRDDAPRKLMKKPPKAAEKEVAAQVAASAVLMGMACAARAVRPPEKKEDWREVRARLVEQEKAMAKCLKGSFCQGGSALDAAWRHEGKLIEKGSLLVSLPGDHYSLDQQYFHKAVILIIKTDERGDVGATRLRATFYSCGYEVILNRPTEWKVEDMGEVAPYEAPLKAPIS